MATAPSARPSAVDDDLAPHEPDADLLGVGEEADLRPLTRPPGATGEVFWVYAIAFALMHAVALLAFVPYFFSWSGVALAVAGYFLIGAVGINLCYHRLLTHRSLVVPKWLEHFFAILGVCNLQDAPARWVATHRMHHQFSDVERDPHSPLVDFLWGHFGWLVYKNRYLASSDFYDRYARDLLKDPFYMRLEKNLVWFWVYLGHAALYYLIGGGIGWAATGRYMGGVQLGLSWLVWGVAVRTVAVWHVTWAVNSVTHLWGYRNYPTKDHSRNQWVVALLTSGEGWHNNHHAKPRWASHGHRWWELDATYWFILMLEKLGLAKQVVHPQPYQAPAENR